MFFEAINDRFAETILGEDGENAGRFDWIEIHGLRMDAAGNCESDNDDPIFFSVFAHHKTGGVSCVGDFYAHHLARQYADELAAAHHWPSTDHALGAVAVRHYPALSTAIRFIATSSYATQAADLVEHAHVALRALESAPAHAAAGVKPTCKETIYSMLGCICTLRLYALKLECRTCAGDFSDLAFDTAMVDLLRAV